MTAQMLKRLAKLEEQSAPPSALRTVHLVGVSDFAEEGAEIASLILSGRAQAGDDFIVLGPPISRLSETDRKAVQ